MHFAQPGSLDQGSLWASHLNGDGFKLKHGISSSGLSHVWRWSAVRLLPVHFSGWHSFGCTFGKSSHALWPLTPGLTWECFVFFNLPHPLVSPPSSCRISVFYYYLNSMVFSVFNISFSTFSIAYSLSKAHSCSQDLWFHKLGALLKTCKCFLIASARKPRCHRLYLNPLWVTWSKSLDVQPSIS